VIHAEAKNVTALANPVGVPMRRIALVLAKLWQEAFRPAVPRPLVVWARRHQARRDRIDAHAKRSELLGELLDQADPSMLGGEIAMNAAQTGGQPRAARNDDDVSGALCRR